MNSIKMTEWNSNKKRLNLHITDLNKFLNLFNYITDCSNEPSHYNELDFSLALINRFTRMKLTRSGYSASHW